MKFVCSIHAQLSFIPRLRSNDEAGSTSPRHALVLHKTSRRDEMVRDPRRDRLSETVSRVETETTSLESSFMMNT